MQPGILDTPAILNALIKHATPQLAEMEFRGFALASTAQVQQLAQIVAGRTHILRQLNLLGIQFPTTLAAAATITTNAGFLVRFWPPCKQSNPWTKSAALDSAPPRPTVS
jgi:hypothetical protein